MERYAEISRRTAETDVRLSLSLDGSGKTSIATGCGFFDHMLNLFASHARFDLSIACRGDIEVDAHHTVEDVGICLGRAFREALGDKRGVARYGDRILPMDEALALSAVDLSGRSYLAYTADLPAPRVGDFDTELGEEFFAAFAREAGLTLHIRVLAGRNTHHILEAVFKSAAHSLADAVRVDPAREDVPSTKGVLE